MGELSRQDMLDKAALAYEHASAMIYSMDKVFQRFSNVEYDPNLTLAQFDLILQGVLLSVACADGIFVPEELDFLKQFVIHGNLLEYIKKDSDGTVDLSWEDVAELPPETTDELLRMLPLILDSQCQSLIIPLLKVDYSYSKHGAVETTPGDFLKEIEKDMIYIASTLAFVDCEGTDEELNAAAKMIFELEGKHWRTVLSGNALGDGNS